MFLFLEGFHSPAQLHLDVFQRSAWALPISHSHFSDLWSPDLVLWNTKLFHDLGSFPAVGVSSCICCWPEDIFIFSSIWATRLSQSSQFCFSFCCGWPGFSKCRSLATLVLITLVSCDLSFHVCGLALFTHSMWLYRRYSKFREAFFLVSLTFSAP